LDATAEISASEATILRAIVDLMVRCQQAWSSAASLVENVWLRSRYLARAQARDMGAINLHRILSKGSAGRLGAQHEAEEGPTASGGQQFEKGPLFGLAGRVQSAMQLDSVLSVALDVGIRQVRSLSVQEALLDEASAIRGSKSLALGAIAPLRQGES